MYKHPNTDQNTVVMKQKLWMRRYILPAVCEMTLIGVLNACEGMIAGIYGKEAVAAYGLAQQPRLFAVCLFSAVNIGVVAQTAKLCAEKKREMANRLLLGALTLVALASGLAGLCMYMLPEQAIWLAGGRAVNDDQMIAAGAKEYLRISSIGFPAQMLWLCMCASLRGRGKGKNALLCSVISGGSIALLGLGLSHSGRWLGARPLAGMAVISVIGQVLGLAYGTVSLIRLKCIGKPYVKRGLFDLRLMKDTLTIGMYSALEQVGLRLGYLISGRILFGLGTTLFAANQICQQVTSVIYAIGDGFAVSGTALAGMQKDVTGRKSALNTCFLAAALASLTVAAALIILSRQIPVLFIQNREGDAAQVLLQSGNAVRLIACFAPFQICALMMAGALRGIGKNRYAAAVSVLCTGLIRTLLIRFAIERSSEALWMVWAYALVESILRFVLMGIAFIKAKRNADECVPQ